MKRIVAIALGVVAATAYGSDLSQQTATSSRIKGVRTLCLHQIPKQRDLTPFSSRRKWTRNEYARERKS